MMKFQLTAWIMSITFGPYILCSLQDKDPKCRYTVHLPEASWHTAYSVCDSRNRTLAQITSLSEMYFLDLVLEEVDDLLETHSGLRISGGIWIGAFLRSSSNESMLENCDHLDFEIPLNITGVSPGNMFCLYYNRLQGILVTENCSTAKMFLCEKNNEDLGECMLESSTSAIKENDIFKLCSFVNHNNVSNLIHCESFCIMDAQCYTFIYKNKTEKCYLYSIHDKDLECSINVGRNPPSTLRHKSIFLLHNNSIYPTSEAQLLSDWCPEITKEVIQEKIANIRKNLTINRKETSQYISTLTSAPDQRRSSKIIGVTGAFVIGAIGSIFILSDCINFIKGIRKNNERVSSK